MFEERTLKKWFSFEIQTLNKNLVRTQRILIEVTNEDKPFTYTNDGKQYLFDTNSIKLMKENLKEELRSQLKIPIIFYFNVRVPDECYLTDEIAAQALKELGELSALYEFRANKLWLSKPIAYEIYKKYPTIIQFAMG